MNGALKIRSGNAPPPPGKVFYYPLENIQAIRRTFILWQRSEHVLHVVRKKKVCIRIKIFQRWQTNYQFNSTFANRILSNHIMLLPCTSVGKGGDRAATEGKGRQTHSRGYWVCKLEVNNPVVNNKATSRGHQLPLTHQSVIQPGVYTLLIQYIHTLAVHILVWLCGLSTIIHYNNIAHILFAYLKLNTVFFFFFK